MVIGMNTDIRCLIDGVYRYIVMNPMEENYHDKLKLFSVSMNEYIYVSIYLCFFVLNMYPHVYVSLSTYLQNFKIVCKPVLEPIFEYAFQSYSLMSRGWCYFMF
jgi:hypothetical protein